MIGKGHARVQYERMHTFKRSDPGPGALHEFLRGTRRPLGSGRGLTLCLCLRLWLSVALSASEPAFAQSTGPGAEVIMGQSHRESAPRSRTLTETHAGTPASPPADFHAKVIAPLPPQSYPRKSKRARKHRLDLDRDGYVSRSEIELELQGRASAFRRADVNQDGKLDAEEQRQYQKLAQPRRGH
jgi:hypothetical protein